MRDVDLKWVDADVNLHDFLEVPFCLKNWRGSTAGSASRGIIEVPDNFPAKVLPCFLMRAPPIMVNFVAASNELLMRLQWRLA